MKTRSDFLRLIFVLALGFMTAINGGCNGGGGDAASAPGGETAVPTAYRLMGSTSALLKAIRIPTWVRL
jgi:hypothetical protein